MRVRVSGAPGYREFEAETVPGLERFRVADDQPFVTVLFTVDSLGDPEYHVIESEYVQEVTAA